MENFTTKKPDDYVIATGQTHSKRFYKLSLQSCKIKIKWIGKGMNEKAYEIKGNKRKLMIKIDKNILDPWT